jgi:hypothetical protein
MALALLFFSLVAAVLMPVWFAPALVFGFAVWCLQPGLSLGAALLVGGLLGLAAPMSVGLAGAILDRACAAGGLVYREGAPRTFRVAGLVLAGVVVFETAAPHELLVAVRTLLARGEGLDLLGIVTRVGGAVCFCGGALAVVGLGAIALVEVPLRWCVAGYRVTPLDITLGALRPLIVVLVAAGLFQLGSALVIREAAPRILGGVP